MGGPHRDDLDIHLDGREIRAFGSSGQQRSALLILDLAAISLYNLAANDSPVFIIDDVDAELDEKRITHLLEYLANRTQTFITTFFFNDTATTEIYTLSLHDALPI